MDTDLRIADVAKAAGISPATIRYYERIGVLPSPVRAGNGYRTYDDHTVERLAFIGRAKQLGCTLDEITGLTTAWDGGECGPIQDRLRGLVADKRATAQREIVELVTLSAELRDAAAALERHRPTGVCDERCGCISNPSADAAATECAVSPTADGCGPSDVPVACTLPADRMMERTNEWRRIIAATHPTTRSGIDGGVRLEFPSGTDISEIARLAVAEQDCCRFFSFTITIDARGIGLEVTGPDNALDAVHALVAPAA